MIKFLTIIAFISISYFVCSQTIKNEGAKVIVKDGTYLIFSNLHNSGAGGQFYYNNDINVPGNWTNISPATFEQGPNGSVSFVGTNQQTITSGGSYFGNLTINNTSGSPSAIVLADNMSVSVGLNLTKGIVSTGSNKVIFQDGSVADVGNSLSFIDGKMQKAGSTVFTFPSGDIVTRNIGEGNTEYRLWSPIKASPAASTTMDVEYFFDNSGMPDWWEHGGNMDATLHHVSDREYWLVSSTANLNNVTLYWNNNDHTSPNGICKHGFDSGNEADFNPSDLTLAYWNGSMWVNASDNVLGPGSIVHDAGFLTSDISVPFGAKSQSFITYGSKDNLNPLPVELVFLTAECNGSQIDILWQTASETNNSGFVIEKSIDAKVFSQIGFIAGLGNSSISHNYSFSDLKPFKDNNYYRLKQLDIDGKFVYSNIVFTSCDNDSNFEPSFIVYPNPSKEIINIMADNMPGSTTVIGIYNILGSLVYQTKESTVSGTAFGRFDISELPPAMYMVKVISGNYVATKKIEKQ